MSSVQYPCWMMNIWEYDANQVMGIITIHWGHRYQLSINLSTLREPPQGDIWSRQQEKGHHLQLHHDFISNESYYMYRVESWTGGPPRMLSLALPARATGPSLGRPPDSADGVSIMFYKGRVLLEGTARLYCIPRYTPKALCVSSCIWVIVIPASLVLPHSPSGRMTMLGGSSHGSLLWWMCFWG